MGDAKKRLEIVKAQRGVTNREVCAAELKVADAYLEANDAPGYEDAKLDADGTCLMADLDSSRSGYDEAYREDERITADNLEIVDTPAGEGA